MSWHLAVSGQCMLPADKVDAWPRIALAPASTADLAQASPAWFTTRFVPTTVGALLEDLRRFSETPGPEFLDVKVAGRRVDVRGFVGEGNLGARLEPFVAAMRAAGVAGAVGDMLVIGVDHPNTGRLTLAQDSARWEVLTEAAARSAGAPYLASEITKQSNKRAGVTPPKRAKAKRAAEEAPALSAVTDALSSYEAAAILQATKRARIKVVMAREDRIATLDEVLPDGSAILAATRPGTASLAKLGVTDGVYAKLAVTPAFGIQILAELAPQAAEPLALALLEKKLGADESATHAVWLAAARALGHISTPTAVAALVAALDRSDPFPAAAGLARARSDVAGPPLLAWLVPKRLKAAASASAVELEQVLRAVEALGALRYEPAAAPLAAAWRATTKPELARRVGAALLEIGDGAALRALEERVDDDDDLTARIAMTAWIRRDATAALAALRPEFERTRGVADTEARLRRISSGKESVDRGYRALAALAGGYLIHLPLEQPTDYAAHPIVDARWTALAGQALGDPVLSDAAVVYLAETRDPTAARLLADRAGELEVESVAFALEHIGDKSVLPTLEKLAAAAHPERAARLQSAIGRIQRGERPGKDD